MQQKRLTRWEDWYRFARNELGYAHKESVEYATLRYVEEMNRSRRQRAGGLTSPVGR
jgi:hypothetical protein